MTSVFDIYLQPKQYAHMLAATKLVLLNITRLSAAAKRVLSWLKMGKTVFVSHYH